VRRSHSASTIAAASSSTAAAGSCVSVVISVTFTDYRDRGKGPIRR
jgi:hypothetical protein